MIDPINPPQDLALNSPTDESDEQLMSRIQGGDESALAILHTRHHRLLRLVISRMINNDQDVDELVQECLFEVWRHSANYSVEKGCALAWIVTMVRRRTIDRIRRKSAYGRAQERFRDESANLIQVGFSSADEVASRSERGEAVTRMLSHLPEAQKEVVQLSFYKGLSHRQIAQQTGIPLGTIKTRLELGLRKLRSAVLAFGELSNRDLIRA